jgi:hypothetical protein
VHRALLFIPLALAYLAAQESNQPYKFGTTVIQPLGLKGQIYHLRRETRYLPDFKKMKPVGTIYTPTLNVPPEHFTQGFPGVTKRFEWFAIDYTGRFWISRPGLYQFALLSDDGSKLYIDDQLIIENDGIHSVHEERGQVELSEGMHRIRVSYFQGPRFELALVLRVSAPGQRLSLFSTDDFKPPPDAQWTDTEEEPRDKKGRKK